MHCTQEFFQYSPPVCPPSFMCDCKQIAALELEQADTVREENSQLRWDLQEAQQTLAQRSSNYEVRMHTYVCTVHVGMCV